VTHDYGFKAFEIFRVLLLLSANNLAKGIFEKGKEIKILDIVQITWISGFESSHYFRLQFFVFR
jgi:hypothetical protein